MKLKITFKDPDGVSESIREAVENQVQDIADISEEERESVSEKRQESTHEALEQWIDSREYITVEFDTIARTATVIKN